MDPQNCTHTLLLSTSPCTLSHDTRTAPYVGYPKLHDAYDYTHSPVSTALLHTLTQPFSEMLMEVFFTHFGHPIRACVWRYSHPVQILLLHLSRRSHCSNSLTLPLWRQWHPPGCWGLHALVLGWIHSLWKWSLPSLSPSNDLIPLNQLKS